MDSFAESLARGKEEIGFKGLTLLLWTSLCVKLSFQQRPIVIGFNTPARVIFGARNNLAG